MNFSPSPQQLAILDEVRGGLRQNLIIEASAGCAKTTTLTLLAPYLEGNTLFCAFNKDIVADINDKISTLNLSDFNVSTIHSAGLSILRKNIMNIKVSGSKLYYIARDMFDKNMWAVAMKGAAMAKSIMPDSYEEWEKMFLDYNIWDFAPSDCSDEAGIEAAQRLLAASNGQTKIVDFDDMIYLPVILENLKVWKYTNILLDEAQDTNTARRQFIKRILKPNGHLIAVGDSNQAIYGFTGANYNSLELIREEFDCKTLPLNVTYRCPKRIVEIANKYVPDFIAHDTAPEGEVRKESLANLVNVVTKNDAILCRNTSPLIKLAYTFIREGIPCRVLGREIGKGLVKLAKKWKTIKTVGDLNTKLDEYLDNETAKVIRLKGKNEGQDLNDKVQTLKAFIAQCEPTDTIKKLEDMITSLFDDDFVGCLTLSTIHKSKGREWDTVFLLGNNKYIPSKYATTKEQIQQEENLAYVSITRTKETLIIVDLV
jgi:DNA helicase-2/ATP-dependent DNA helicase PcrA